jgi:beta-lactamase regulating signal transducer with metallopeptidase domain/protein involved in polysaccharide export with SLBB domain
MNAKFANAALLVFSSPELSLLVKATLVLAVGWLAARLAYNARASVRHLVVATSFVALAVLPVLIASVPVFAIGVAVAGEPAGALPPAARASLDDTSTSAGAVPVDQSPARTSWSLTQWLRAAWATGVVLFLLPVASALWRLSTIGRTGLPAAWARAEFARLTSARGVSVPIELLEHEAVAGPMTFGITRPVIVLPPDAREWSSAELRCALMHELEHIQRRDWLMQIVARSVAAFYWFHPMVWSAWRRLCLEAERSCDDAVVAREERTDYAAQLVTLAQRMSDTIARPMLGMANRTDLSARVTAVLDDRLRRGRAGFAAAAGIVLAALLVVGSVAPVSAVAKPGRIAAAVDETSTQAPEPRFVRAAEQPLDQPAKAGDSSRVTTSTSGVTKSAKVIGGEAVRPVRAQIANNQTRSIFVLGEIRKPGRYSIEGDVTLLEVIENAGSLTLAAGGDITVHRYSDPQAARSTPAAPGDARVSEVLRATIDELKAGRVTSTLQLQDGDTIFIVPAPRFYVVGHIRTPGSFVLTPNMTVGNAIAIAGGLTVRGSSDGIKILRRVDGAPVEVDAGMEDVIRPNDTIRVRQRVQ